jgi:hypothetical protein
MMELLTGAISLATPPLKAETGGRLRLGAPSYENAGAYFEDLAGLRYTYLKVSSK